MKQLKWLWETICMMLDAMTQDGCCSSPVDEDISSCLNKMQDVDYTPEGEEL